MSFISYSDITSLTLYPLGDRDNEIDSHVNVKYQDSMRGDKPYPQGISDDHMGAVSHDWVCGTCRQDKKLCPGHFGSINLNYPVLSPFYIKEIIKWLKVVCFNCGGLVVDYKEMAVKPDKVLNAYAKLIKTTNKEIKCVNCEAPHPHITKDKSDPVSIFIEIYETKPGQTKGLLTNRAQLYPHRIAMILSKIKDDVVLKMKKPLECHPRKFVLDVLRVPPNPIRPDIKRAGSGRSNNNDLTVLLQAIVKINESIPNKIPAVIDQELNIQIHNLNLAVYEMIKGSSSTSKRAIVNNSKKLLTSVAKRLPRKFGRIRRNLLGKRVSNMARSFITCDPFLNLYEIGLPISIAKNLTMPITVREYNYEECLMYFMNGNKRYPGCKKIKKASTGKEHLVEYVQKLEIGDVIYRHLITGDWINFNRQPSLLSSSITSMKIVVKEKGETISFNVIMCSAFNADFDGDSNKIASPTGETFASCVITCEDKVCKLHFYSHL